MKALYQLIHKPLNDNFKNRSSNTRF